MSEPAAASTTQTRPADLKGFLALPPAALCSTPPSWPLMKPQLQTCASARPQTAGPPCWSQPARTGTSKPGSSPRTPRVRPGEAGVARQRVACQLGCFSLTLCSPAPPRQLTELPPGPVTSSGPIAAWYPSAAASQLTALCWPSAFRRWWRCGAPPPGSS